MVPFTTEEQGRTRYPARGQKETTESGTESTLEFNSFNSDLTSPRSHGPQGARTISEPRCPHSAQHSVHFPLPPHPRSQLETTENLITKLISLPPKPNLFFSVFSLQKFPISPSREVRIINPMLPITELKQLPPCGQSSFIYTHPTSRIILT